MERERAPVLHKAGGGRLSLKGAVPPFPAMSLYRARPDD